MEKEVETTARGLQGLRVEKQLENQMENAVENEMKAGGEWGLYRDLVSTT